MRLKALFSPLNALFSPFNALLLDLKPSALNLIAFIKPQIERGTVEADGIQRKRRQQERVAIKINQASVISKVLKA